jgi:hypothetical protein
VRPGEIGYNVGIYLNFVEWLEKKRPVVPKDCPEAEKEKLKTIQKEWVRKKDEYVDKIATKVSMFKRNFFAYIYEKTINGFLKAQFTTFKFSNRPKEQIWVIPQRN